MKTVLVAGGGGFIGSHVCERLLSTGARVICIDNFITGRKDNVSQFLQNPDFKLIEYDITRPFPTLSEEVHEIYHLASPASPNKNSPRSYIAHPIETLLVNSVGTYNLLEFAKGKPIRFLFASTSEVYGDPTVSPQREDYFGNVNPNGLRSVYDEGKRFSEAMVMAYVRKFGTDARIVRIFNTYGPRMQKDDGRVVSNFINQAIAHKPLTIYGDGSQTRSFCYIDDMVEGLTRAMEKDVKGEVINIGSPDEQTIRDMAEIIKRLTNSTSEIVFSALPEDDPKQRKPDIGKAQKLLGFRPKVSLEDGLKKTIEYFKNYPIPTSGAGTPKNI